MVYPHRKTNQAQAIIEYVLTLWILIFGLLIFFNVPKTLTDASLARQSQIGQYLEQENIE